MSWSLSNQPVLWDFYIIFLLVASLWMFVTVFCPKRGVIGDVWRHAILTLHAAFEEYRREKSPRVRDGPLERLCTPINPKKYSCYSLKKNSYKEFDNKKNSCRSKIPLPPNNFSNGSSLSWVCCFWRWSKLQHYVRTLLYLWLFFFSILRNLLRI